MAKVYLLQNVPGIGNKGMIVDVKDGFAANFLIPRRFAKIAQPNEIALAQKSVEDAQESAKKKSKIAQKLSTTSQAILVKNAVKVEVQTSAGGRVHGSVDPSAVVDSLIQNAQFKNFEKNELAVKLSQRIEYVGKYAIELKITLREDGREESFTMPLYIDVVSISEAKRKSRGGDAKAETNDEPKEKKTRTYRKP